MLSTDPKTGILRKTVPDLDEIEVKLKFIKSFVNLCVQSSHSPIGRKVSSEQVPPRYDLGDSIATRVVAVVKKLDSSGDHDHVVMQTLLLNTLGLQAYLQLALDGKLLHYSTLSPLYYPTLYDMNSMHHHHHHHHHIMKCHA